MATTLTLSIDKLCAQAEMHFELLRNAAFRVIIQQKLKEQQSNKSLNPPLHPL